VPRDTKRAKQGFADVGEKRDWLTLVAAFFGLVASFLALATAWTNYSHTKLLEGRTKAIEGQTTRVGKEVEQLRETIPKVSVLITDPEDGEEIVETPMVKGQVTPGTTFRVVFLAARSDSAKVPSWQIIGQAQPEVSGHWSQRVSLTNVKDVPFVGSIKLRAVLTEDPKAYLVGASVLTFPDPTKGPDIESNTVTIRSQR
jgi:hypothetical protein